MDNVMKKWAVLIVMAFFILGGIIGILIVSPLFHIDSKTGGSIGLFVGLLLSWPVPGLWKSLADITNENTKKAIDENSYAGPFGYMIYPTQMPLTIGLAWFLGFLITMVTFPNIFKSFQEPSELVPMWLMPWLFMTGLSGFL